MFPAGLAACCTLSEHTYERANSLPQNALHQFLPQLSSVLFVQRQLHHSHTNALPPMMVNSKHLGSCGILESKKNQPALNFVS